MKESRQRYSDKELLEILREFFYLNNKKVTNKEIDNNKNLPSSLTYLKRFGGVKKALILLGLVEQTSKIDFKKKTNDQIVKMVKDYYKSNNDKICQKDFGSKNNLPCTNMIISRFGSIKNLYLLCGIEIEDKYFSDFKGMTDVELIDKLKWFNETVGFPTQRAVSKHQDMPSHLIYFKRFGSFKKALMLADIPIIEDKKHNFNRVHLSDEQLLLSLKIETEKHLKSNLFLMTHYDINENNNMQSGSVYILRFGGTEEAYRLIGYDFNSFNNFRLEEDMLEKYKELQTILNRTPNSRDVDEYCKNGFGYSMKAYINHFGSLSQLQKSCGFYITRSGLNKNKEELLQDVKSLAKDLNRTPTFADIKNEPSIASVKKYIDVFGSWENALRVANLEPNNKIYYSENGQRCLSVYELSFTNMLEKNNIYYEKEVLYANVIFNFSKRYRFDYQIKYKNKTYYIEIFGMIGYKPYENKIKEKIQLCKENNIPLIEFYPENFYTTIHGSLYDQLLNKIHQHNNQQTLTCNAQTC